ncbi:AsmA family protein, partial [bacterium]|nr:AsmA family protein [bacterium]
MHTKVPKILIKVFFFILAFLFVLYLAILLLFPKNFNIDNFKSQLEKEIYTQTGLTAGIENISVKTSLSPYINISAYHVILMYPNKQELLKVKDLDIRVKVFPIIFKKIQIDKIDLNRPILGLSIAKDGSCSLDKYLSLQFKPKGTFSGFKFDDKIPRIELNRYKIKIYDSKYKNPFIAEGEKIKLECTDSSGGIKTTLNGILKYNNIPYITYSTELVTDIPKAQEKLFQTNPFEYIRKLHIKGNISSKIILKKDSNKNIKTSGNAVINNLSFVMNNKKIENNFISLKFDGNKIVINSDLKTDNKDKINVSGSIILGQNPNINLKCIANNINLKILTETAVTVLNVFNIKNELSLYNVSGIGNFDFKIKGNKNHLQSQGRAEFVNVSATNKRSQYKIANLNSKINLDDNIIKINPSIMYVNGTKISFAGQIDSKTNMNIDISGKNLSCEKDIQRFLPANIKKDNHINGVIDFNTKIKGNFKKPNHETVTNLKNFIWTNKDVKIINCKME